MSAMLLLAAGLIAQSGWQVEVLGAGGDLTELSGRVVVIPNTTGGKGGSAPIGPLYVVNGVPRQFGIVSLAFAPDGTITIAQLSSGFGRMSAKNNAPGHFRGGRATIGLQGPAMFSPVPGGAHMTGGTIRVTPIP